MSARWKEVDDLELLQLESEMREELQALRTAATVYADRAWERGDAVDEIARARQLSNRSLSARAAFLGWKAWATVGLAAVALAIGGVRIASHHEAAGAFDASATASPAQPNAAVSDEALLQQIQSDISSGVPTAMEPLQTGDSKATVSAVRQ